MRRRGFVATLVAIAMSPFAKRAAAQVPEDNGMQKALQEFTRGAAVKPGRVALTLPRLADNGHSVPLRVTVESAMTDSDRVRAVVLLSPRNPRPMMATIRFGPGSPRAEVATRVRLNGTQRVLAVAELSDGSFWSATAEVEVTESACLDAS